MLVKKKNGSCGFALNTDTLNKCTTPDSYRLPRFYGAIDTVRHWKFFSSVDLRARYWQINVAEVDKCKTAFRTPSGLYEFNRMPFGLRTAPSTFQRAMNSVLGPLKNQACVVYWDDILVVGKAEGEHIRNLDKVLHRLFEAGFRLNREKCQFGLSQISYLGHNISPNGVQPLPERIAEISEYPTPTCFKQVQFFIGMASYLRKFIPHLASIAAPLSDLLKNEARFEWGTLQENAFRAIKRALTSAQY